jgi:hypothetical protein
MFLDGIEHYWPYLKGSPTFACENTHAALPNLLPPSVDCSMLRRLIRFAVADNWGRARRYVAIAQPASPCAEYIEEILPRQALRSTLAREVGLNITIGIDLHGPGGGEWSCNWRQGELVYARPGLEHGAALTYHTDTQTFQNVVSGLQTPQEAFFENRIAITGDIEAALKLAVLFGQFLSETGVARTRHMEVLDSTPFKS